MRTVVSVRNNSSIYIFNNKFGGWGGVGWGEWAKGVALGMYLLLWEHGLRMQVLFFFSFFLGGLAM
jgi:hypothetical protein